jgi:hypothetical protein
MYVRDQRYFNYRSSNEQRYSSNQDMVVAQRLMGKKHQALSKEIST